MATRIHWQASPRAGATTTGCGRSVFSNASRTRMVAAVTCLKCQGTDLFKAAKVREGVEAAVGTPNGEVSRTLVFTQASVKDILDSIFDAAHQAAEEQGVCETYNEIMEDVENHVPEWYKVPARKGSWFLTAHPNTRYQSDMTRDELIAAIKDDPEKYVLIEVG